jgi:hypothetical protein
VILPYKNPEDAKKWSLEYSRRPEVKERTKKTNKKYRERPVIFKTKYIE